MDNDDVTFLIVGDTHFHPKRFKESQKLIDKTVNLASSMKGLDYVVLMGDILHTHETIKTVALNQASQLIFALAEICPVYVLVGNHDYINNQQFLSTNHPFNILKNTANVIVVDHVVSLTIREMTFLFTPYVPPGRFIEALETFKGWKKATCIFAHQEIQGVRLSASEVSTKGDVWSVDLPIVISGHIHDHQIMHNVYYTGSASQISFGEDEDKKMCIASFPLKDFSDIKRVDLGLPKKIILVLSVEDVFEEFEGLESVHKNSVRLDISGTKDDIEGLKQSTRYAKLNKMGFTFKWYPTKVDREKIATTREDFTHILERLIQQRDERVGKVYTTIKTNTRG